MKKVLIIIPSLQTGGGEKLATDITLFMDKSKFDLQILSFFGPLDSPFEKRVESAGIMTKYLGKKFGFDKSIFKKAKEAIKAFNPDIIHTHLGVIPYILSSTSRYKQKFHTVHSMASREASGIRKYLHLIAFKLFGFVPVAICPTVQKSIAEYYNMPIEKIPCINNGIDRTMFKYVNEEKKDDHLRIVATGGFRPVKNHILMIKAYDLFLKRYPDSELVILGDGEMRKNIEEAVEKYNLHEKVILKGNVSNVAEELNKSDIYIMSSDYEGLSLAIAEAMSCGLPIVTTASGGTVDIVKDGINGFVTSIGDAEALAESLYKLAVNKDLRKQMAEKSLELVEDFDIVKTVKQYEELFEGKR